MKTLLNMKKIFILSISCLVLALSGCKTGLDAELFGSLNPTLFPSTAAEYELYMMEVYVPFSSKWPYDDGGQTKFHFFGLEEGHIQLFDAPTDIMAVFTDWGDGGPLWESKSRGNFAPMVSQWRDRSHFEKVRFVTGATKIIDDLEKATVFQNEAKKNQLIGEVKMARAYAMYFMLHLYGPVPVILDPAKIGDPVAEADLTRPSREVYVNAIATDLRFAADNLPKDAAQYGRFNKGLALTTLMRLYLNEKNFTKAESVGREIATLGYSLVADYASLFKVATEKNNETIYAISCTDASQGRGSDGNFNAYAYYTRPNDYPGRSGWAWNSPFLASWEFYDSFDPTDKRRALIKGSYQGTWGIRDRNNDLKGAVIDKYPVETSGTFQGNDIVIARYADVMLMLAEAINENNNGPTSEAIALVDAVRDRAGLPGLSAGDKASKQAFNNAILKERGWELYFEGVRKFDLQRHGKWPTAVQVVSGKTNVSPYLLPIPQYALNDSKGALKQNPGY